MLVCLIHDESDGGVLSAASYTTHVLSDETQHRAKIAMADYNGDGSSDIAVLSEGRSILWVFVNDGNGNFGNGVLVDASAISNRAVAAGDLDGDGDIDIVCLNSYQMTLYRNLGGTGEPSFQEELLYTSTHFGGVGKLVLVHDIDGLGRNDIATGPSFSDYGPLWFRNVGGGAFAPPVDFAEKIVGPYVRFMGFTDVNEDGIDDLIVASVTEIYAYIGGNGPATDPPATDSPATDPPATDPPATDPPNSGTCFSRDGRSRSRERAQSAWTCSKLVI
jgi:hypothetical protein